MRVHYMVGALLTAALITGCQTSTAADEEAIREAIAAWNPAYNSQDADAIAALYTEDGVRIVPNMGALQGRGVIRAAFVEEWESGIWASDAQDEISNGGKVVSAALRIPLATDLMQKVQSRQFHHLHSDQHILSH